MSALAYESKMLVAAEAIIKCITANYGPDEVQEARFQILEGVASRVGGFSLNEFRNYFQVLPIISSDDCLEHARQILEEITKTGISAPLAVSALAREALAHPERRQTGAYHTDFRLAQHLALKLSPCLDSHTRIIDPACGAGILLTAVSIQACGADRQFASKWLSECVYAADLSLNALRGTLISLACLTDDLDALAKMRAHWFCGDALLRPSIEWGSMSISGFDAVIANPPWEKLKLSKHEFMKSKGQTRTYGSEYTEFDDEGYAEGKAQASSYTRAVVDRHSTTATGEPDMFVAFTELALTLLKPSGQMAILVPAGLIRSKNTTSLRRKISTTAATLSVDIFDNKARFFDIDTRFKFLCVHIQSRSADKKIMPVELAHAHGTPTGVKIDSSVTLGRTRLARIRSDLSLPEVRNEKEWLLFCRMNEAGVDWARPASHWHPAFMREVDMTRDRPKFLKCGAHDALPVIEGRMVHQHRVGAKFYIDGSGRSATWGIKQPGASAIQPQFHISANNLIAAARARSNRPRAGFCDITGQTNERSVLAAIIPAGVVCGNKVPTILFPNDPREERLWLWVAIANSFAFDWLMRRIITTTINYFHLLSVRLPAVEPDSLPGRQLIAIARELAVLDQAGANQLVLQQIADLRSRADRLVLTAYGLNDDDLDLILKDFPLIDRRSSGRGGENRITVTRDLLISHSKKSTMASAAKDRTDQSKKLGVAAYVPAEVATEISTGRHKVYG